MKRYALLAALFVIIATAAPVKAEAPCPLCFVASWVDTPNGAELPIDNAYLAGWAFKCSSGETPISIAAYVTQGGTETQVMTLIGYHARPDVSAMAVSAGCGNPAVPGFTVGLGGSFSLGAATVRLVATSAAGESSTQIRSVIFIP